ncbi:MAG: PAS domain-containing protein, partial [bacterium]
YSVYHVTHAEHSALYDARIIYVNHKFEALGGLPARAVLGHSVRELFPHVGEGWYLSVKAAACDGTPVDRDYEDEFSGKHYRFIARQLSQPGYCAVIYMKA